MKYRCVYSGKIIECLASLGKGGEGEVFATNVDGMVAKIYHSHRQPGEEKIAKLLYMIGNTPEQPQSIDNHIAITWPRDLLERNGTVHGFLMDASTGDALEKAVTPSTRKKRFPGQTWRHSLATAYNLAWVVANIHAKGYVIGDVNEQNIRTQVGGVVSIIDIDSFQIHDVTNGRIYPCLVMTPDFAAPELTSEMMSRGQRSANQDCFSLAIIIYRLLMCGNHPFNGVYQLPGDSPEQRTAIVKGYTVFDPQGPYKPRPKAPSPDILPPMLTQLFERAFVAGHRNPVMRPTALEWKNALLSILGAAGGVKDCPGNPLHAYSYHLPGCPWCDLFQRGQVDYYDPRVTAPRTQINRPKIYTPPSRTKTAVPGMQMQIPVQTVQPLPASAAPPPPAFRSPPQQSRTLPGSPGRRANTAGTVAQPAAASSIPGYCMRVLMAMAIAGLFLWLNLSSLIWPYPYWGSFVEKATVLRYEVSSWLERNLREYGINLSIAARMPQDAVQDAGMWIIASSTGKTPNDIGGIAPNSDGLNDDRSFSAR